MATKASGRAKTSRSSRGSKAKTRGARPAKAKAARPAKGRPAAAAKQQSRPGRRARPAAGQATRQTRATARKSSKRSAATTGAPRRGPGRSRQPLEDFTDVTSEIQERYDAEEDDVPTPPSTLDLDRHASAARTGHDELAKRRRRHTAASPLISGGDVDADWEQAYFVGDESATADNPTPDQSEVEDIGRAIGVDYQDTEELKSTPKVEKRDRKRWELDPASSEDYKERVDRKRNK